MNHAHFQLKFKICPDRKHELVHTDTRFVHFLGYVLSGCSFSHTPSVAAFFTPIFSYASIVGVWGCRRRCCCRGLTESPFFSLFVPQRRQQQQRNTRIYRTAAAANAAQGGLRRRRQLGLEGCKEACRTSGGSSRLRCPGTNGGSSYYVGRKKPRAAAAAEGEELRRRKRATP